MKKSFLLAFLAVFFTTSFARAEDRLAGPRSMLAGFGFCALGAGAGGAAAAIVKRNRIALGSIVPLFGCSALGASHGASLLAAQQMEIELDVTHLRLESVRSLMQGFAAKYKLSYEDFKSDFFGGFSNEELADVHVPSVYREQFLLDVVQLREQFREALDLLVENDPAISQANDVKVENMGTGGVHTPGYGVYGAQ